MNESRPVSLSQEQCNIEMSRTLHDARLIEEGARMIAPGILYLSDIQFEKAHLTGDPLSESYAEFAAKRLSASHFELEPTPQDIWLDQEIKLVLQEGSSAKGYTQLTCEGFSTMRDILTVGKKRMVEMYDIKPAMIKRIERTIGSRGFELKLYDEPTPEYIASFCNNLSQVNYKLINDFYISYITNRGRISIQDVLENGKQLRDESDHIDFDCLVVEDEIYRRASLFALKFEKQREKIALQPLAEDKF